MYRVKTLNNISPSVLEVLRSSEYDYDFDENTKCIGRAGIGVNTIPLEECASKGIVVFNTPGGNANAVKELFLFGISMACRDLSGALDWVKEYDGSEGPVEVRMEKIKKKFAGPEYYGKTLGVVGTGSPKNMQSG